MTIAPHICQRIQRTQKAVTWAERINDSSYVGLNVFLQHHTHLSHDWLVFPLFELLKC